MTFSLNRTRNFGTKPLRKAYCAQALKIFDKPVDPAANFIILKKKNTKSIIFVISIVLIPFLKTKFGMFWNPENRNKLIFLINMGDEVGNSSRIGDDTNLNQDELILQQQRQIEKEVGN